MTEAPTVTKSSLWTLFVLAVQFQWEIAAGDIQAAFLNGAESRRGMRQPQRGLPGLKPGQIVEVVKGIFGLATSPRLWRKRLAQELTELKVVINDKVLMLHQHVLDSCLFVLRDQDGGMIRGALATHVDDILIAAPKAEMTALQNNLSVIFPISEWEVDDFEYIGSQVQQADGKIKVGQSGYVKSRLETVNIPKGANEEQIVDEVTKMDNQPVVGGLSWLVFTNETRLADGSVHGTAQTEAPHVCRRQGDEQDG